MIVLVTGSREWFDEPPILQALETAHQRWPNDLTVIEGGARGADRVAGFWASMSRQQGVGWVRFNAKWEEHDIAWCTRYACDGFGHCRAAGPRRNQEMLDWALSSPAGRLGVITLAFKDSMDPALAHGGTEDMVRRSIDAGVETHTYSHEHLWQVHPAYAG